MNELPSAPGEAQRVQLPPSHPRRQPQLAPLIVATLAIAMFAVVFHGLAAALGVPASLIALERLVARFQDPPR